jgi:hypothetical protein
MHANGRFRANPMHIGATLVFGADQVEHHGQA